MKYIVFSGQRYGFLTVLSLDLTPRNSTTAYYICKCDCGREKSISKPCLYTGKTKSCGCIRSMMVSCKNKKHGMAGSPTYVSWKSMRTRCTNPSFPKYPLYGGRGIKVCDRWASFESFLSDMGERPDGTTLDRINVDGDYSPENCRWATSTEQARNKTNSKYLSAFGKTMCIADWSDVTGISASKISERVLRGWSNERSLTP